MELLIDVASWICLLTGGFVGITGAIGLFRFPDIYTRLHASSITDTSCMGLIMLGLILQAGLSVLLLKLLLVMLILAYTSPTVAHILIKTARREGPEPILDNKEVES
ncbi:MAG: monovalent cation/H(+) antiporter subunit G [Hyphomicrobiales bacterium]|nr:monovalent cation/H(+) antiporter subunit G [Hyphomicrobiales bacterium]